MESAKAFETGKQLIGPAGSEISTLSAAASAGSAVASVFPQHATFDQRYARRNDRN